MIPTAVTAATSLGAPVVALPAVVVLVVRRPRWALWWGAPLLVLAAGTWLGYWYLWGEAFAYADAYQPVPAGTQTAKDVTIVACACACLVLVAGAVTALVTPRRPGTGQPMRS